MNERTQLFVFYKSCLKCPGQWSQAFEKQIFNTVPCYVIWRKIDCPYNNSCATKYVLKKLVPIKHCVVYRLPWYLYRDRRSSRVPDKLKRRFCFAPTTSIMFGAPNSTKSDTSRPKSSNASADPRQICNIRSKHFSRTGLPASTLKTSSPIMLPTCNANLCVTL